LSIASFFYWFPRRDNEIRVKYFLIPYLVVKLLRAPKLLMHRMIEREKKVAGHVDILHDKTPKLLTAR